MSQSLYTAMGGIAAATTELQVISNNVANINTTAFKASSVNFADVFSTTISSGSVSSGNSGGTNPIQVGVGVQVSAISKDFSSGSWVSTGGDTDLMIGGSGFFTVQSTDNKIYYTRAGDFSFDDSGNLVTSGGTKVLGTNSILSSTSSGDTVYIPQTIISDVAGNENIASKSINDLNNVKGNITSGVFTINVTDFGATTSHEVKIYVEPNDVDANATVQTLTDSIQSQLGGTGVTATCTDGALKFTINPAVAKALSFGATDNSDTSNVVARTNLANSTLNATTNTYSSKVLDYTANVSELTSASEAISRSTYSVNTDGSVQVTYTNGDTLSVQLGSDNATYEFVYTTSEGVEISGNNCTVDANVAVPANFVIQLATITNTDGLISVGSNLFKAGPNSGDIAYTVGGEMGAGELKSGGLESSNVDLSEELSNMILAQRAIQANSRVFTTTSDTMDTIVNMGR